MTTNRDIVVKLMELTRAKQITWHKVRDREYEHCGAVLRAYMSSKFDGSILLFILYAADYALTCSVEVNGGLTDYLLGTSDDVQAIVDLTTEAERQACPYYYYKSPNILMLEAMSRFLDTVGEDND